MADLLQKCGPIEEQNIFYHPMTKRHLGIARIVFMDVQSARNCIERYNGKSVMGKELLVFQDAFGARCKQMFEEVTTGKKPMNPIVQPPVVQPQHPLPTFGKDETISHHSDKEFHPVDFDSIYNQSAHGSADLKGELFKVTATNQNNKNANPLDHKLEDGEWNDSRDKYDDYGYDERSESSRHYRYDKKESRRYDKYHHSSSYHKNEKDRRERDRREYRRDERDRERIRSSRRRSSREYDYK